MGKGEFAFAAVALDHGHIYGQCKGLMEAGGGVSEHPAASGTATVTTPPPSKLMKPRRACSCFCGAGLDAIAFILFARS